jgi:2-polyprenyl-6-methoxyphenol hydroxylase-like FAD-dependent oxidoreductase
MNTTDVLVVGAGPTGLLLAGDLAESGVRVTVLERRSAEESNLTRAFAVHARTLEELDARGVADELISTGQRLAQFRLFGSVRVNLAGLPSRFPYVLITPQYQTERVLRRRAEAAGAHIERGYEVVALRQDATGVEVDVRDGDGVLSTRRATYLVGADGVRSAVRRLLGEPFPGRAVVRSVMLADVRFAQPPSDVLAVDTSTDGFAFVVPFGDGWHRVIAWDRRVQQPDDAPVSLDEVRGILRSVFRADFGLRQARWTSRFHSDERQAPRYRVGRVFLAGDAAHVHSPAGGQGMNTGLQDAANLGWRLAASVHGWAPQHVLDGYQEERHRIGRLVLLGSGGLIRAAKLRSAVGRTARTLLIGGALRIPPVARRIGGAVSGIGVRYRAPKGAHRLVGTRVGDLRLTGEGPARLYEALRGGHFVLVSAEATSVDPGEAPKSNRNGWSGPIVRVAAATPIGVELLIRPDGYVAWAADRANG